MRQEDIEESVTESGYRQIRAEIIFRRFLPGQKLKMENLKGAYGTSVSTLREILNRLALEGLVAAEGQRGFEVAGVSVADLREITALRLLLEEYALGQCFKQGTWSGRRSWCLPTISWRAWNCDGDERCSPSRSGYVNPVL
ncbi:DNA-binding GntR family transcriptional regulator [Rhizobium leguminosarum]